MSEQLTIRRATREDAAFVARMVMMALHSEENPDILAIMTNVCTMDATLYSWRHALVAEAEGQPAGLCLCYDGAGYSAMRARTFAFFPQADDGLDLENMEDETCAGEYYVDSLAVLPAFRQRGIARQLLEAQVAAGLSQHLIPTLLVDPDNPPALRLYRAVGFTYLCDTYAFGQTYWKMHWQR